jgi:hypothetical protein
MGPSPPGPGAVLPTLDQAGAQQQAINTQTAGQQQAINTSVAGQQAAQNKKTAQQQQAFNVGSQAGSQYNVNAGPYGSIGYTQTGVGPNGVPTYTANVNMSPAEMELFGGQTANQLLAGGAAANLVAGAGYGSQPVSEAVGDITSGITGGNLAQEVAGLQPYFNMQNEQEQAKLYNQGISPGTNPEAYNAAMMPFMGAQDSTVAQFLAQQEPVVQQQAMSEYELPFQMAMGAIPEIGPTSPTGIASQVSQPALGPTNVTPTTVGPTTVYPTNELSQLGPMEQAQMQQYQAQQSQYNAMIAALGGIGAAGVKGAMTPAGAAAATA